MEGLLGKTLDNSYRVDQLLGKGGMGAVYRARDIALNRDVAIKVMHAHFTDDENFRARFLQEARAIAALDHPGIVEVHAFGQDLGQLYIVMDFIPGQTLHAWLRRLADEHKIVALTESMDIVRRVAWALHYAHEKGVLHRDVKPGNIMLKPTDPALGEAGDLPFHPVLTDFGLAKLAEGGVQTRTGTAMGSPAYMSPEQCLGTEPDRRSDIYSLGIILYELVTGRVPFEIKSLTEAIRRHTQEPPPPPRSVNPALPVEVENIILRALSKRAEDRFATAREMADALRDAIPHVPQGMTVAPTIADGAKPYVSLMTRMAEDSVVPSPPGSELWEAAPPASGLGGALVIVAPGGQSRRVSLGEKRTLSVGRTPGNDIQLNDVAASRHHARIVFDGQTCTVTDLDSTNGTYLGNSKLLPGVSQPWPPGAALRIGGHWLRFEGQAAPGPSLSGMPSRMGTVAGAPSRMGVGPNVVLEPPTLSAEAGQRAVARLRILNQGTQVDHFAVAVDGIPPSWMTLPGEPLRLNPNEEGIVPLTFHPPRDANSTAGQHPLDIRVISQADPRQVGRVSGALTIPPFHEFTAEMSPQQISTGRARLRLMNQGNAPTNLTIMATDPAETLDVQARASQLVLRAGEQQIVPLEAKSRKGRPWLGAIQRHPFEVSVIPSAGRALKQGGTLIVKPIIPLWVLPVLALVSMLLCAGAIMGYKMYTDRINATATAVSVTAVAAVTETAVTDADGDGLTDLEESKLGTDPLKADTDGDGLSDKEEAGYGTKPVVADTDGDGLLDGDEITWGANPLAVDSDGDTWLDGHEVHEKHTSPINADTDGDGINDSVDPDPGKLPTPTATPNHTATAQVIAGQTATAQAFIDATATAQAAAAATEAAQAANSETATALANVHETETAQAAAAGGTAQAAAATATAQAATDATATAQAVAATATAQAATDATATAQAAAATATAQAAAGEMGKFTGNWANVDSNTLGMTRLVIAKVNDSTVTFHGYGSCTPNDCDWGTINVPFTSPELVGTYDFGFKKTKISVQRSGDQLLAEVIDDYPAPQVDRINNYTMKKSFIGIIMPPMLIITAIAFPTATP